MGLVTNNKVDANTYELEITVDAEKFEAAVEEAYRKNRNKISVQGFRKGKAPRKMIERLYGEGVFFEDAANALLPDAVANAVEEADLNLVTTPSIEVTEIGKDKGLVFKATCTTKPEVAVKDYKGIKLTKTVKTVTDEDVTAEVSKLLEKGARMVTVEDRAAESGDIVDIDFEGFVDGEAFQGGKAEHFSLTLGSGQFIPGFEEQVVGKSIGDDFDVNVSFPEDYNAENLKGKAAVFKCKLHGITKKEIPEADDEFAKDSSEFDTLDELKADLRKKLEEAAEKAAESKLDQSLSEAVIGKLEAEIPPVMFENRTNELVHDFEHRLSHQGMSLELYLQYTGTEMDTLRKTFGEQAESQVKLRLALEQIAKNESIEISDEELDAEYEKLASQYGMEKDQVKGFVPADDLAADMKVSNAAKFVRDNAEITTENE